MYIILCTLHQPARSTSILTYFSTTIITYKSVDSNYHSKITNTTNNPSFIPYPQPTYTMKRRNIFKSNNDGLPSLSNGHRIDGSGRGVHMDAPIVKNWKNASGYTRWSYIWTFGSLATMVLSYKYMLYHYGMYNIQYQYSLKKIDDV